MKIGSKLALISLCFSLVQPFAHAGQEPSGMIELGAGAQISDKTEVLLKVELDKGSSIGSSSNNTFIVWGKLNAELASDGKTMGEINIDFHSLGFGATTDADGLQASGFVSLFNANIQRDLSINEALSMRISLLGFKGEMGGKISENIKLFGTLALNTLSYAISKRASDGQKVEGFTFSKPDLEAKIGAEFSEQFKIALGFDVRGSLGDPETYYTYHQECRDVWVEDPVYGNYWEYRCDNVKDTHTGYHQSAQQTRLSLEMAYELTNHIRLFGAVQYKVFSMDDDKGTFMGSTDKQWKLRIGGSYVF